MLRINVRLKWEYNFKLMSRLYLIENDVAPP